MEKWESKASGILKYRRMVNQSEVVEGSRKSDGEIDCEAFHVWGDWGLYRWVLEMAWKKDGLKPSDIFPDRYDSIDDEDIMESWSVDSFFFAFGGDGVW